MTEDEAKTKWCPHARIALSLEAHDGSGWIGVAGANRAPLSPDVGLVGVTDATNPESARCIASACMAWRWLPRVGDETLIEAIRRHRQEHGSELREAKEYVETHPAYLRRAPASGAGYCGLAGAQP